MIETLVERSLLNSLFSDLGMMIMFKLPLILHLIYRNVFVSSIDLIAFCILLYLDEL